MYYIKPLQCTNTFLIAPPMSQKTPTMSQNGKNTFKINDQSSIHFNSYNCSLDTFNSFLLQSRYEKLNEMYLRQGHVINAHSLAIRDLDQMSAAQFQKDHIIHETPSSGSIQKVDTKHLSQESKHALKLIFLFFKHLL
jgi:hypothetical protein